LRGIFQQYLNYNQRQKYAISRELGYVVRRTLEEEQPKIVDHMHYDAARVARKAAKKAARVATQRAASAGFKVTSRRIANEARAVCAKLSTNKKFINLCATQARKRLAAYQKTAVPRWVYYAEKRAAMAAEKKAAAEAVGQVGPFAARRLPGLAYATARRTFAQEFRRSQDQYKRIAERDLETLMQQKRDWWLNASRVILHNVDAAVRAAMWNTTKGPIQEAEMRAAKAGFKGALRVAKAVSAQHLGPVFTHAGEMVLQSAVRSADKIAMGNDNWTPEWKDDPELKHPPFTGLPPFVGLLQEKRRSKKVDPVEAEGQALADGIAMADEDGAGVEEGNSYGTNATYPQNWFRVHKWEEMLHKAPKTVADPEIKGPAIRPGELREAVGTDVDTSYDAGYGLTWDYAKGEYVPHAEEQRPGRPFAFKREPLLAKPPTKLKELPKPPRTPFVDPFPTERYKSDWGIDDMILEEAGKGEIHEKYVKAPHYVKQIPKNSMSARAFKKLHPSSMLTTEITRPTKSETHDDPVDDLEQISASLASELSQGS